ncbi:MAG: 2-hydroxyglutaryl-CoA dehydratase [Archaeoglobales archaeon]|nr:2-hydroxyglutaryl-CoA dehydratase [Archaeoglobales archaeon]
MIFAGIDIGSLTAKCVVIKDSEILAYSIQKVKPNLEETALEVFQEALKIAGLEGRDVSKVFSTGYGRYQVRFAERAVTEITCHAVGAHFLIPTVRTVIDIGGQDSKVIAVEEGRVLSFAMNDKCSAGTGRFLEVMANALNLKLEQLGEIALRAKKKITISSTCTVFAESEVISYISSGEEIENIVAGICDAIASRIVGLASRVGVREDVVLTGGVAKNLGVKKALEEKLGLTIKIPEEPQIVGALGAAVLAMKSWEKVN